MSTLHVFNPWHDEALAAHRSHYTPRLAARRLGVALAHLPQWWRAEGDRCLGLPLDFDLDPLPVVEWGGVERIEPWGWDVYLVRLLRKMGAPARLLPTDERLDELRAMSSRAVGVRLQQWISETQLPEGVMSPRSCWCADMAGVEAAIAQCGEEGVVLKAPWSSSGRGVFSTRNGEGAVARARAQRCLRQQGGVEVQPYWRRVADGALEFGMAADGRVVFWGCSLFSTEDNGGYGGHVVDSPERLQSRFLALWQQVCPQVSAAVLQRSFVRLVELLSEGLARGLGGRYVGLLGVDVLFTEQGLHPCIEINLRRTMGHVALDMARRLPAERLPTAFEVGFEG